MLNRSEPRIFLSNTYLTQADPMQTRPDQIPIRCKPNPTEADPMLNRSEPIPNVYKPYPTQADPMHNRSAQIPIR